MKWSAESSRIHVRMTPVTLRLLSRFLWCVGCLRAQPYAVSEGGLKVPNSGLEFQNRANLGFFPLMRSWKVFSLVCWDIGFAHCHRSMRSRTSEWWWCSGIWKQAIEFSKWVTGACAWTISRTYYFFSPIWKTRTLLAYECLVLLFKRNSERWACGSFIGVICNF